MVGYGDKRISFCNGPPEDNSHFCDVPPTLEARQTKALEDIASSLSAISFLLNSLYTEMMGESPLSEKEEDEECDGT